MRRGRHYIAALQRLSAVYALVRDSEYIIPVNVHATMMEHVDKFFLHYNWLARNAADNLCMCHPFTSKFHYLWHIIQQAKFLSPRAAWCYEFEHFVGQVIRAAKACGRHQNEPCGCESGR